MCKVKRVEAVIKKNGAQSHAAAMQTASQCHTSASMIALLSHTEGCITHFLSSSYVRTIDWWLQLHGCVRVSLGNEKYVHVRFILAVSGNTFSLNIIGESLLLLLPASVKLGQKLGVRSHIFHHICA